MIQEPSDEKKCGALQSSCSEEAILTYSQDEEKRENSTCKENSERLRQGRGKAGNTHMYSYFCFIHSLFGLRGTIPQKQKKKKENKVSREPFRVPQPSASTAKTSRVPYCTAAR